MSENDCDDCQKRHGICTEIMKQKARAQRAKCLWKAPDPHEPPNGQFQPLKHSEKTNILNDSVR